VKNLTTGWFKLFLILCIIVCNYSRAEEYFGRADTSFKSIEYVQVSNSVVMIKSLRENGSNITCIALNEGLVFVDCGFFTDIAAKFRKDMEEKYQKKTMALVFTHEHTDHFFGMGAFANVPIIFNNKGKEIFQFQINIDYKSRVEGYKRVFPKFDKALEIAKLSMPTKWYDEDLTLGSNELIIKLTGGHSSSCSYIYFPQEKVLVAGDNLQVDYYPYFGDQTGDMNAWIETLKKWEEMDIEKFCPGHGGVVDKAYLTSTRIYFEQLLAAINKLKADGIPVEQAVNHPSLPKGYWPEEIKKPGWFESSIALLYQQAKQ
jgi:cyclase